MGSSCFSKYQDSELERVGKFMTKYRVKSLIHYVPFVAILSYI